MGLFNFWKKKPEPKQYWSPNQHIEEEWLTQQMRNAFSNKKNMIFCKTPIEINKQYKAYKTKRDNLEKRLESMTMFTSLAEKYFYEIKTLNIKIKLLENILKIK